MGRVCSSAVILCGSLCFLFGLLAFTSLSPLLMQMIVENRVMTLEPGSNFYDSFTHPERSMTKMHVHLFEMMNSRDFLRGAKPKLREHGPFVFDTKIKKFNVSFSDKNRKLTYYQKYVYSFNRGESVGDIQTYSITTVNFPLNMILSRIDKLSMNGLLSLLQGPVKSFVKDALNRDGEYILERRTVGEILVGRKVDFIRRVQNYIDLAKSFGLDLGMSLEKMKSIGYFRTTNNSVIGPLTIRTGRRSYKESMQEYLYHNSDDPILALMNSYMNSAQESQESIPPNSGSSAGRRLKRTTPDRFYDRQFMEAYSDSGKRFYEPVPAPGCNERRGTDGSVFNVYSIRERRDLFVNTPFCRYMRMKFVNISTPRDAPHLPPLAHYVSDPNSFNYGGDYWCFCAEGRKQKIQASQKKGSRRTPSRTLVSPKSSRSGKYQSSTWMCDGVYDYSQCQKSASVYMSFPYFKDSPQLAAYIDGWKGKSLRDFEPQFSVHPELGVPFRVRFQMQFNVKITPSMTNNGRSRSMYLPFLWFEQRFDLNEKMREKISMFDKGSGGFRYFWLLFATIGLLVILLGLRSCLKSSRNGHEKFIEEEDVEYEVADDVKGADKKPSKSYKPKIFSGSNVAIAPVLDATKEIRRRPPKKVGEIFARNGQKRSSNSSGKDLLHSNSPDDIWTMTPVE